MSISKNLRLLTGCFLMILFVFLLMPSKVLAAGPYTVQQGDFVFQVYIGESNNLESIILKEYKGTSTEVELPTPSSMTINGKTYSTAGGEFIVGDGSTPVFPANKVKKVAIPKGYTAIQKSAFEGCTALTEMAIADTVEYVGGNAFGGCSNLTTYYLDCDPSLTQGGGGDPHIGQSTGGKLNFNQATVYVKKGSTNVKTYVETVNNLDSSSSPRIKLVELEVNPYSKSTVKPGSGQSGSSDPGKTDTSKETKGEDGTALGKGASKSLADKFLTKYSSEKDPAGSVFLVLQLNAKKVTKKSIKLKWKKAPGAVRYIVYGNKCGTKNRYVKQAETKATSLTVKKVAKKAVKKGTYYKFIVVALNSKDKVVSTSKTVHAATLGGKVGNAKKLTTKAKKNKVILKKKKTFKLKAKAIKASKKIKMKNHRGILYESSNPKVASVNKKGVIKGVSKGKCKVYAYAQNGICQVINVTVK